MKTLTARTAAKRSVFAGLTLTSPYTGKQVTIADLRPVGCHVEVTDTDGHRFLVDRQTKVRRS